jgi:16S rRNA (cytosine1402-N4)-methyltransferase
MTYMNETYHIPVLLKESVGGIVLDPGGVYVDVTFGGGGHSSAILSKLSAKGRLIAFDQDSDARKNIIDDTRLQFVRHNFRYIRNFLRYYGISKVDGILADLGVSSHHFDEAERGFSFRFDGELDMRMDRDQKFTAKDLLNEYTVEKLEGILKLYGELSNSKKLAQVLVEARQKGQLKTIAQLKDAALAIFPNKNPLVMNKYLAQVFQGIRLEVNGELKALEELLFASPDLLAPGGRIAIISYHSLEDRMVKNFFRTGNLSGDIEKDFYGNTSSPLEPVSRKVIVPSDEELRANSRARSAKLRIAEKL